MAAYVIALVQVNDADEYAKYAALTGPLIKQFGGRFLVRGGAAEVLEGADFDRRMVIVEFPDNETARRFYDSEEYQAARSIRVPASEAQFILVDGA